MDEGFHSRPCARRPRGAQHLDQRSGFSWSRSMLLSIQALTRPDDAHATKNCAFLRSALRYRRHRRERRVRRAGSRKRAVYRTPCRITGLRPCERRPSGAQHLDQRSGASWSRCLACVCSDPPGRRARDGELRVLSICTEISPTPTRTANETRGIAETRSFVSRRICNRPGARRPRGAQHLDQRSGASWSRCSLCGSSPARTTRTRRRTARCFDPSRPRSVCLYSSPVPISLARTRPHAFSLHPPSSLASPPSSPLLPRFLGRSNCAVPEDSEPIIFLARNGAQCQLARDFLAPAASSLPRASPHARCAPPPRAPPGSRARSRAPPARSSRAAAAPSGAPLVAARSVRSRLAPPAAVRTTTVRSISPRSPSGWRICGARKPPARARRCG